MLSKLSDWVTRWDAATRTPQWRLGGIAVGLVVVGVLRSFPAPAGLSEQAWATAAIALLMAGWWVAQVLPLAVTGLIPIVAFPLLGLASPGEVTPSYAHPLLFLMLGGFLLAAAIEQVGLHRRIVANLLSFEFVRASPARVVGALMLAAALLSGLVSNTATMVMLLPMATVLAALCTEDPRQRTAFVLGLAFASSIGGVATLVGTPPNAVLAGIAGDQGIDLGFARWMGIGLPFVAVALPIAWYVVTHIAIPLPARTDAIEAPVPPAWSPSEASVLGVVTLAMVAWFTRGQWSAGYAWKGSEADALVAMVAGIAVFAIPRRREGRWTLLLDWRTAERTVPWSVILLLGGGFALAGQIQGSGLTAWVASGAGSLEGLPLPLTVLGVCLAMTYLTELTSNTASTQIALPLLAAAAVQAGVEPLYWMVPATISASCAFMMPVATAPNAIATEAGGLSPADLALAGLILNPLLAVVVTILSLILIPLVLG